MGLFDSNANTKTTDLSDKSNSSAGEDLIDIGQVSGKKNTQNVDLSRTNVEDSNNTDNSRDFSGAYAGNSGTINLTDGGAIDALESAFASFSAQTTKQLETTQSLAKSVTTGGQTVVAESSVQMIKYISYGVGFVGLVYIAGSVIKAKAK